ncbi:MAG: hypothetical protein ACQETB_10710 [Halobacteriota archaeon]
MSLDELNEDVKDAYRRLGADLSVDLDRETRTELSMLQAVFETENTDELIHRAIHELYRRTVDTGDLDFQLRTNYDVTYDEYLAGMTYEEMTGGDQLPSLDENNRYRM